MADIRRYPFLRHLRSGPTQHVVHLRQGRQVHSGVGQSFWFRPLAAALSEVPVDDRELPLLFHARTADFQDVTVQLTVAYRVSDPELAATRIDFSIDPETGSWRGTPLDQVAQVLGELAQQQALAVLADLALDRAITEGPALVRRQIADGLAADPRVAQTGLGVVAVNVVALRPDADLERALQMPTRELVQGEADRATFERRALAVERERAISENELQSRIELAAREEELVARQGANERRRAEEAAAAAAIEARASAERDRLLAETKAESRRLHTAAEADNVRTVGAARGEAEAATLAAYQGVEPAVLMALAVRELAGQLPEIGQLTISPDVVTAALARLAAPAPR